MTSPSVLYVPTTTVEPTLPSFRLESRQTDASTTSCPPDFLVIQLATTISVPNYQRYYREPIESFQPSWECQGDGSLLAPPYREDMLESNLDLLVISCVALIFLRNILVSGDYLRRGKVKKKGLFYGLFLSQVLAPGAVVPLLLSYFSDTADCTRILQLACAFSMTSLSILLTGILGYKVYKCMDNSKLVLLALALFQAGSSATTILDVVSTVGLRRLTVSCTRLNSLQFVRYYVTIQFLESLFICCCFMYVLYKSRRSPMARNRISVELSMSEMPINVPEDNDKASMTEETRGWWDYAPKSATQVSATLPDRPQPTPKLRQLIISAPGQQQTPMPRKMASATPRKNKLQRFRDNATEEAASRSSTFSAFTHFPPMELFQKVMKDELTYTTFITCSYVVIAILALIGVNFDNCLNVAAWVLLNWAIVSLMTIHSFGRVVHRHEREALLSHPAVCNSISQTANNWVRRRVGISGPIPASLDLSQKTPLARMTTMRNAASDPFKDPSPTNSRTARSAVDLHNDLHIGASIYPSPQQPSFKFDGNRFSSASTNSLYSLDNKSDARTSYLGTPIEATYDLPHIHADPDNWLTFAEVSGNSSIRSRSPR